MIKKNMQTSVMLNDIKDYLTSMTRQQFLDFYSPGETSEGLLFAEINIWKKMNYKELIEKISDVQCAPSVFVIPGGSDRDKEGMRNKRESGIIIIICGEFNADGYDEAVQDIADYVEERFMPLSTAPSVGCVIRGVIYEPDGIEAVETKNNVDALAVRLEAIDFRRIDADRHNSGHFMPLKKTNQ